MLEVAPVGEVQKPDVVHEHHDSRRLRLRLRRVTEPEPLALEARGRVGVEGLAEHLVELVRRHLHAPLADDLERRRDHQLDALLGLRRHDDNRRERGELELLCERLLPEGRLAFRRLDEVDLVHDDDQALPRLERVAGDVLVLGEHAGGSLDDEEHGVRALHRGDAAQQAVALEPVAARRLAANARRVDQDDRHSFELELRVHRVARRARRRAHERALVAQERVEQRRLADVRAAHDREPVGVLVPRALLLRGRQHLDHAIEQVADAEAMLRREQAGLVEAELEQLMREVAFRVRVGLVRGDDDYASGPAQQARDVAVDRRETLADVEHEQDELRLVDRYARLRLDRRARLVLRRVEVQPGGVDHRELAAAPLGDAVQAVAGQPGGGVDDRLAIAEQAVEERRLADVGAANDGDDRPGHSRILTLRTTAAPAQLTALRMPKPVPSRLSSTIELVSELSTALTTGFWAPTKSAISASATNPWPKTPTTHAAAKVA